MASLFHDNFKDYFEPENVPEEKESKPHEETPEEKEERELKALTIERAHNRKRIVLVSVAVLAVLAIVGWTWNRYFHPYIVSEERGVIMKVKNQGSLIKTYEVQMVAEKLISDTVRRYKASFEFTIKDDSLARLASNLQSTGYRVIVAYEEYKGNLPWRGETNRYATDIRLADSTQIIATP